MENEEKTLYGLIPIPSSLPKIIYFPNNPMRYILIEKVIYEYVNEIFSNYRVEFRTIVSVTRNADIALSNSQIDEDEDYKGYMKKILKKRIRLAPIRLEFYKYSDIRIKKISM